MYGHLEIIKYLLENEGFESDDALSSAASSGHLDIVKYLISLGTNNLNTPLFNASAIAFCDDAATSKASSQKAIAEGHLEIVEYFEDRRYTTE